MLQLSCQMLQYKQFSCIYILLLFRNRFLFCSKSDNFNRLCNLKPQWFLDSAMFARTWDRILPWWILKKAMLMDVDFLSEIFGLCREHSVHYIPNNKYNILSLPYINHTYTDSCMEALSLISKFATSCGIVMFSY